MRTTNPAIAPAAILARLRYALNDEARMTNMNVKVGEEQRTEYAPSLQGVALVHLSRRGTICHGRVVYTGGHRWCLHHLDGLSQIPGVPGRGPLGVKAG